MQFWPLYIPGLIPALFLLWASSSASAQSLSDLATSARSSGAAVFGSTEFRSERLTGLPQWTRVLRAMTKQGEEFRRCTRSAELCQTAQQRSWRKIITKAATMPRKEQLKAVNTYFNRWPYKYDQEVYGKSDYWATPTEFLTHSGDCEDYSISKYFALRQLGFQKEELRIIVIWDEIRGIGHAVLSYHGGEDILILDSLTKFIVSDKRFKHYIPQISMNETTRWAHVVQGKKIPLPVATQG